MKICWGGGKPVHFLTGTCHVKCIYDSHSNLHCVWLFLYCPLLSYPMQNKGRLLAVTSYGLLQIVRIWFSLRVRQVKSRTVTKHAKTNRTPTFTWCQTLEIICITEYTHLFCSKENDFGYQYFISWNVSNWHAYPIVDHPTSIRPSINFFSLSHLLWDHWSEFFETCLRCSPSGLVVSAQKMVPVRRQIWPPAAIFSFHRYRISSNTPGDI